MVVYGWFAHKAHFYVKGTLDPIVEGLYDTTKQRGVVGYFRVHACMLGLGLGWGNGDSFV